MKRVCVLLAACSVAFAARAGDDEDIRRELKALEGTWKAVSMEAGGAQLPKEQMPEFAFVVAAEGKATGKSPRGEYQATIVVDPKASPRTIVNRHESGPSKGKKQYGVYKLEGDKWTVCMTRPGVAESARPKDFATKDTANVTFVFERVKETKKP